MLLNERRKIYRSVVRSIYGRAQSFLFENVKRFFLYLVYASNKKSR